MISTSFWGADGKPISVEEFMNNLYGALPSFFKTEEDLRKIWSDPVTRKALLDKLSEAGYGAEQLSELQKLVDAEKSDLFDVLEYIAFHVAPITRESRVAGAQHAILNGLSVQQKDFLEFVLFKYIDTGVQELDQSKLPQLMELKYQTIADGIDVLGGIDSARNLFLGFQKHLYI
jgi:type I restriction enzyme R subunit